MFGVYAVNHFSGVIISIFIMLVIINSINLIDGIDGLASGMVMMAGTVFGVWFFLAGQIVYSVLAFALVGSLAGFFLFNVFGKSNKLFMGDSGSLVIGLILSILVIKFNEFNVRNITPYAVGAAPAVSFAIIVIPLIDTLRVFTIRVLEKRSPFSPDNHHVHHRLLKLVPSHFKVSLIIVFANSIIIGIALIFNNMGFNVNIQFLAIFLIGLVTCYLPGLILKFVSVKTSMKKLAKMFE